MRRHVGVIGVVLSLAGCMVPAPLRLPAARLVGLSGSARTIALGQDEGLYVTQLTFLGNGQLLAASREPYGDPKGPAGLGAMSLATGQRTGFVPAGGNHEAVRFVEVVAPARDGGAWLADDLGVYRLQPNRQVETVDRVASSPSSSPTARLDAASTAATSSSPASPAALPSRPWGDTGIRALADDGAGGVYVARFKEVWRLPQKGGPQLLAELPDEVRGLAVWGAGVVALLAAARDGGGALPASVAREALWEVVPGQAARPWAPAKHVGIPMAIATAPTGAVIVADGGDGARQLDTDESSPYTTTITRIGPDGHAQPLLHSERDEGPVTGFQLLDVIWPDSYDIAALTADVDGRIAFVTRRRNKLVVWSP